MTPARIEHTRLLAILGALAVGLLLLLVVPAMASANAPETATPPAAQEEFPAAEAPADQPAPAGEAPPADGAVPGDQAAAPGDPLQPAPPPATEPETSTPAPAPAGDPQPAPPLVPGTPAAPEAPATETESAPEGHATTIVLPGVASLPSSGRAPPALERTVSAEPPPVAAAPTLTPVAPPSAPPDPPTVASPPARARAHPAPPPRSDLVEALGGVHRGPPDALTRTREVGPGPAGVPAEAEDGTNPFATLAAPGGPVPAGSSLLAVLASYVLPGGGLPTSTLILFIQLAVILAAFYAPRSGLGERIHALGRLGPRLGYRTVLARPG
jgi:hypothetical protein